MITLILSLVILALFIWLIRLLIKRNKLESYIKLSLKRQKKINNKKSIDETLEEIKQNMK
jgi:hypothetical protein